MDYKTGDKIPESEILRRLQDEDGAFYLELRGETDQLFRVGPSNSLFFKLEKTGDLMQRLKVIDDFRPFGDIEEEVKEEDPDIEPSDEITLKIDLAKVRKKLEEITFDEGQKIPDGLKSKCKQNEYGGYSLEYNKYLYVLDSEFRVEIKKAAGPVSPNLTLDAESRGTHKPAGEAGLPEMKRKTTLEKGDLLPEHLRSRCDADLSSGGGFRIEIDGTIYLLDKDYRVEIKMSQTSPAFGISTDSMQIEESDSKKQESRHSPETIVDSVLKKFRIAVKFDKIDASLFIEKTLAESNKPVLLKIFHGDLSELNEDTKASASSGRITRVDKGGISLLKAAMLHELYLNSTYRGRGQRAIEFLSHIISPWKDASLTISQKDLSLMEHEGLIDLLNKRSAVYTDIGEIIYQTYSEIKGAVYEEYIDVRKEGKTLFKAFLIDKLYLVISRPDKGDGISLISLCRDIMDFPVS